MTFRLRASKAGRNPETGGPKQVVPPGPGLIRALAGWVLTLSVAGGWARGVQIDEGTHEDRPQFIVHTDHATWFYDRAGGGFSRLIDRDGRDWIAFSKDPLTEFPAAAAAGFRGIPNALFVGPDKGAGHPGFDQCSSERVAPDQIRTRSLSGKWQWSWTFTADTARFVMEQADPEQPWWFLYEGPVAGRFAPTEQYWGTDAGGPLREVPDIRSQRFGRWRWAYFGDQSLPRILFVAQQEPDALDDTFWYLGSSDGGAASAPDGMVVFGFGRGPGTRPLLRGAGHRFIVGLFEMGVVSPADHAALEARIEDAVEPLGPAAMTAPATSTLHHSTPGHAMSVFRSVPSQIRKLRLPLLAVGLALAGSPAVRPAATPSFESRTIETNAVLWWARALGDVNGNGLTDLLLQDNNGHGGVLRWYETRDPGTAWTMHVIAEKAPNGSTFAAGDLAAADINNDGSLDVLGLAHPGEWKQAGAPTEIYWYENPMPKGDPARDAWTAHPIGRAPAFVKDLRLADFNGDGRLDLVVITFEGNRFLVFRQDAPTKWTKVQDFVIPNLHEGLDVGDITGNGRPDVATNGYWVENPGGDLTGEWILRSIDAKWHNQTGDWSRNATKVFCRDITGDGRVEIFISHSERAGYPVSWYRAEDPRQGPWLEQVLTDKLLAVHTLQVFDFNGDGHDDVLAGVNTGRARALGSNKFPVILFLNQGDNRRWQEHLLSTDGIYNGQVADLTGNGAPDIFRMASHDAQQFEVWVNRTPDVSATALPDDGGRP